MRVECLIRFNQLMGLIVVSKKLSWEARKLGGEEGRKTGRNGIRISECGMRKKYKGKL